jgi:hypothetical protein
MEFKMPCFAIIPKRSVFGEFNYSFLEIHSNKEYFISRNYTSFRIPNNS